MLGHARLEAFVGHHGGIVQQALDMGTYSVEK